VEFYFTTKKVSLKFFLNFSANWMFTDPEF